MDVEIIDGRPAEIAVWGGMECTINRVHDRFFDQHAWSGHRTRVREDLELVHSLGIRTLRTALHWEYFERTGSWDFFDHSLGEMQRLSLIPIAGLLHHGSGPPETNLLDPDFPEKLSAYASQVARRYPWITAYTPVNEPHTTSRFSCLYGHWYPHRRDFTSYLRALLNEVKATILTMRAIREVQPEAELIYTEDGGSTFSTVETETARTEREHRRWLGTDLLCARVTPFHPLYGLLIEHGFTHAEIVWFVDNPCPPSIIGLNYYLTSDRFLDHRIHLYPEHFKGGDSGSESLVDIEALRVRPAGIAGADAVLKEAWERYRIPVAITEAHLGGGSEDQIRWLAEIWNAAQAARLSGVDVRAVTVWALFGSWNWCNLCTSDEKAYEPGVFDLTRGKPQPTPLSAFVSGLAQFGNCASPELAKGAWWHDAARIAYRET